MQVIQIDVHQIPELEETAACIGFFDGMHKGHQELLKRTKKTATKKKIKSAIITFEPDPWAVFYPQKELHHLFTLADKIHFAQYMEFDFVYVLHFTKEFASLDITQFHEMLHQMHIHSLICGFDFRYATKNTGNVQTLKEQSYFDVLVVDSINDRSIKISSSRIEPLILQGQVLKANRLCGFAYSMEGVVCHGFKRGSTILGIPTANLDVNNDYIVPVVGVYAGMVSVDDQMYGAMINIGNNPTFENKIQTIEANLFHFNADIYDQTVRFYFLDKIRDEKKFSSAKELKSQLLNDIERSKTRLNTLEKLCNKTCDVWQKHYLVL